MQKYSSDILMFKSKQGTDKLMLNSTKYTPNCCDSRTHPQQGLQV